MKIESLVLGILATWRISCMLYYDKGPAHIFTRFREWAGVSIFAYLDDDEPESFLAQQLVCFWCLTFWIALIIWPVAVYATWLLVPFALSGGALLLSQSGRLIWRKMAED